MEDLGAILDAASKITVAGGLLVLIWAGITKKWVFGWLYDQMVAAYEKRLADQKADFDARLATTEKDRDEWKQRSLDQLDTNKSISSSLEKLVASQVATPPPEAVAKGGPTT
jgi:hypothetical protein